MMNNTPAKTLRRLTDLETGSCASVARIKLDAAEEARLSELGLRPGAEIRRLHGEAGQSILIGVGDGRIGVNFDTAKRITSSNQKKDPLSCFSGELSPAPAGRIVATQKGTARIPLSSPDAPAPRPRRIRSGPHRTSGRSG